MRTTTLVGLALLAAVANGHAASGDPDPSFGNDGAVITPIGGAGVAFALARQSDGKLVAAGAGAQTPGGTAAIAVVRYDTNGVVDPSFGTDGIVTTQVSAGNDRATKVLIQPDGKIVVAGWANQLSPAFAADVVVVRYNSDGSRDAGFGINGVVVTLADPGTGARSAALQADGKIVVVSSGDSDIRVYRYDTAGALDPSFGTGGIVTLDLGGGDDGRDVVIQSDGKIVVAGASSAGPLFLAGTAATLTRLETTGAVDPSYGTAGTVVVSETLINVFDAIVAEPDGEIVAYGARDQGATRRLFRFDTSGVRDGGFDDLPLPTASTAGSSFLAIGADGRLVSLGQFNASGFGSQGSTFKVSRTDTDGTRDASFGQLGHVAVTGLGPSAQPYAIVAEPSGDIVVAGFAYLPSKPVQRGFGLVRLQGASPACATDLDCDLCEACTGGFCRMGPRSGCTLGAPGGAKILVRKGSGKNDLLKLSRKGAVPTFDPTGSDSVGVCLFQNGERTLKAIAPAAGTCGTTPCWSGSAVTGFKYKDKEQTPDGLEVIQIKSNGLKLKARGVQLTTSAQGVPEWYNMGTQSAPVVAQVQASNGACVEATFGSNRNIRPSRMAGVSE